MTHPEPDATIRKELLELFRVKAAQWGTAGHESGMSRPDRYLLHSEYGFAPALKQRLDVAGASADKVIRTRVALELYHELLADGFVIPFEDGSFPGSNHQFVPIAFTRAGVEWARGECRIRTNPHEILDALQSVHDDYPSTVTPGCVALVQEAVHCIESRCFRAAVVLAGVAAEDATGQLMECLCKLTSYTAANGWNDLTNRALAFARRWAGARLVLAEVRQRIQRQLQRPRPDWWSLWENLPESLVPLGEAVRISRNTAAHDADHRFTYLEAATLLCGLPHQLRWIAEIQDHIQNPRDGVTPN